jgi:hypothetical protein
MPQRTGTYTISDLLSVRTGNILGFGIQAVNDTLEADRANHNRIVTDMRATLCTDTLLRSEAYGASFRGEMVELDEVGRAPTQQVEAGGAIATPLKKYGTAVGWTSDYAILRTPADAAQAQIGAETEDLRVIQKQIQRAIYGATNYTVRDRWVDNLALNVKRFLNGDGDAVPNGPNGQTFAGTHSHYLGTAGALTGADLNTLVGHITEHGHTADIEISINVANAATVQALGTAGGFYPLVDGRIDMGANAARVIGALDISQTDNRPIGVMTNGATVWTRPWAQPNYYFAWAKGDARKPLSFREHTEAALRGLRREGQLALFPLYADYLSRLFGVAVRTRTNGAVLYVGNATYQSPAL